MVPRVADVVLLKVVSCCFLLFLDSHIVALVRLKKRSACSHCLGGVRESHTKCSCLDIDISNRSWDTSIIDSLGDQEPAARKSCPAWFDSFGSCAVRLTKRELARALRAFRTLTVCIHEPVRSQDKLLYTGPLRSQSLSWVKITCCLIL